MLNRLPAQLPPLGVMLDDLGHPSARQIGRALGVTERTARRWIAAQDAPRAALLAIFWVTRWGHSSVDADAANSAALHFALSRSLADQLAAARLDLARVLALADTGSANGAIWRAVPLAVVLPFKPRKVPA